MDRDRMEGKAREVTGTAKEKAGEMTGNRELEGRGEYEQADGKAQGMFGKVKDAAGDAVDAVKDATKR